MRLTSLCRRGEGGFDSALFLAMHDRVSVETAVNLETYLGLAGQHEGAFADWQREQDPGKARPSSGSMDAVPRKLDTSQLAADAEAIRAMISADQALLEADPAGELALVLSQTIAHAKTKLTEVEAEIAKVTGD